MRKLVLNVAVSLDGFIEGPNGEFDWCFTDQDYGMTAFLERIDGIVFGRKSYAVLKGLDADPYPDKHKYVVSRTLTETPAGTEILRGDCASEIRAIKNRAGRDLWLFGGAQLTAALLDARLVDELQLAVHPILLGAGKALVHGVTGQTECTLVDTRAYTSGLVQLIYQLKPGQR
jgi:dihydrofolate reductase